MAKRRLKAEGLTRTAPELQVRPAATRFRASPHLHTR